ncbi:MAG: type IV toxin-antitoxin system AbiEi family antitoxin domain-containing protein [Actinomycetota bacterium]
MQPALEDLFARHAGFLDTATLLTVVTRGQLDHLVKSGELARVRHGMYGRAVPDRAGRLAALDRHLGQPAVVCLGTAAALFGFDTEGTTTMHVLDPGIRLRPTLGLMVHQRLGAPLKRVEGRLATAPAWTAVETARMLPRPRALATLDAALHSGWCTPATIEQAIAEQKGRRGIVAVRALAPLADARAESPMESEARLVMIDGGLPKPELQYEIDGPTQSWRVDFAWPEHGVVAEYESVEWHAGRLEMLRDRVRFAAIQQLGLTVIPIVAADVRVHPERLVERIAIHLDRNTPATRRKLA